MKLNKLRRKKTVVEIDRFNMKKKKFDLSITKLVEFIRKLFKNV